jgi:hypothetical protein
MMLSVPHPAANTLSNLGSVFAKASGPGEAVKSRDVVYDVIV